MSSPYIRFVRHVAVLTQEELRELVLRKRAMLSMLLYLGVVGVVVSTLVYIEERLRPSLGVFRAGGSLRDELIEWARARNFGELAQIIAEIATWPSSVVIAQGLYLMWFPTLVALVSCDMVAIDLYRGTLRFLLLRTTRAAYFISKFLAHLLLYFILYALSVLALLIVVFVREGAPSWSNYAMPVVRYSLVLIPFLMFLVASTQFISCWSSKPMNAVVRLHLLWVAFIGLLFVAPWASPLWSFISAGFIAPLGRHLWQSIVGMVIWTMIFSVWGAFILQRRKV